MIKKPDETVLYNPNVMNAVEDGFSKKDKTLPSWLYYDEAGDRLFQQIMEMPEYYLTACEAQILYNRKDRIAKLFSLDKKSFRLVELGAGDGVKTEILLRYFSALRLPFIYAPVDVSQTSLTKLVTRLDTEMPDVDVEPQNKLYHDALKALTLNSDSKKAILFLGANIGNFSVEMAEEFIRDLASNMYSGDWLLIGFDLKKAPNLIQSAYSDKGGITKAFNLNLLKRLNRELGAQFDVDQFDHYSSYDPESGSTKSYLVSQQEQDVFIEALNKSFHFYKWEVINTEISQKYDIAMIKDLAAQAGLTVEDIFYDDKGYFCDVVMRF